MEQKSRKKLSGNHHIVYLQGLLKLINLVAVSQNNIDYSADFKGRLYKKVEFGYSIQGQVAKVKDTVANS